jgi:hypothetical protein
MEKFKEFKSRPKASKSTKDGSASNKKKPSRKQSAWMMGTGCPPEEAYGLYTTSELFQKIEVLKRTSKDHEKKLGGPVPDSKCSSPRPAACQLCAQVTFQRYLPIRIHHTRLKHDRIMHVLCCGMQPS